MTEALFKLVLLGELMEGQKKPDVVRNLAKLFKIAPEQAARMVMGKPVPINQRFARDKAMKLCTQIRQAGAKCKILPLAGGTAAAAKTKTPKVVVCPKCQLKQPPAKMCKSCGAPFVSQALPVATRPPDSGEKDAMAVLVGDKYKNYYKAQFDKFRAKDDRFSITFNKFAFLLTLIWFINRQMYVPALVTGLLYVMLPTHLILLIHLGAGLAGNYLYFRHLQKKLIHLNVPADKLEEMLGQAGGLSPRSIAVASVFSFIMVMGHSFYDQIRVLQVWLSTDYQAIRQNEKIAENRQARESVDNQEQQLVFLASSIKNKYDYHLSLNSMEKPPPSREDLIDRYGMDLESFKDGWSTVIMYRPDDDGFTLISGGPDKKIGTADDIRHFEALPYIPKPMPMRRPRPGAAGEETGATEEGAPEEQAGSKRRIFQGPPPAEREPRPSVPLPPEVEG